MPNSLNPQTFPRTDYTYLPEPARIVSIHRKAMDAVIELEMGDGRALGHMPGQFVQVSRFGYGEIPLSLIHI